MRLVIDSDVCTGHGRCYTLEPDLFESDEEGFGVVRPVEVVAEHAATAVLRCPERAINSVTSSVSAK